MNESTFQWWGKSRTSGGVFGGKGENSTGAKLNCEKVRKIRRMLRRGITQPKIAKAFGVQVQTINMINTNKRWADTQLTTKEINSIKRKIKSND